MRTLAFVIGAGVLVISCSSGKVNLVEKPIIGRIDVKVAGKPSVLDLRSGLMRVTARESPEPGYNYAEYNFALANFDSTDKQALARALDAGTAEIIFFKILGPTGSNKDTPLAAGTYSTDASGLPKYENLSLTIFTMVDGKQTWTRSVSSPAYETKGEVKITAVEGDLVKGEFNITTGNALAAKGVIVAQRTFDKPIFEVPR
jgi:hypothetical protein